MEAYPREYTEHNLPLILLSGLGEGRRDAELAPPVPRQESGTRVHAASPECSGERAQQLLDQFQQLDGSDLAWNVSTLPGPSGTLRYKMKAIGRTYTLPPRKAAPLPQAPSSDGFDDHRGIPLKTELHSPLSPVSPGSPIYPDGVFTPLWFAKHQYQVPAIFIAFFDISATDGSGDEQLKADIESTRTSLTRSGFKTKFAAMLLSDRSILQAPDLEERLSSIRRMTSLDSKTGLFFMPPMSSPAEAASFVRSIMTTLQPLCVEYYRDLTKHARRKKTRGGPQTSMSSLSGTGSLSTPGWNVRYEVKQGAFAEFRQEMDVADRHYSAAIDELFNAEGILEATASWAPRWDEARQLCDSLALRVLRCQLWISQTTGAAQSWSNYKARMKDLVDRRGKGSQTYGWEAWEARWAEIMGQLIQRADLLLLSKAPKQVDESVELASLQVYANPEKAFAATDRVAPLHSLHHTGYWLRMAARRSRQRRDRASAIPEEDRIPPGQSPASSVAQRVRNYDCYLVPDPHEEFQHDHVGTIARLTSGSHKEFSRHGQARMSEVVKLNLAEDFVEAKRYEDAMKVLVPLWEDTTWREEDWHDIFADLLLLLRQCTERLGDAERFLGTTYELLSFKSAFLGYSGFDFSSCLDSLSSKSRSETSLSFRDKQKLSPVTIEFAFDNKETHVGEPLGCQLILTSHASDGCQALTLANVVLSVGLSKTVKLVHGPSAKVDVEDLVDLSRVVEASNGSLEAASNLTLRPKQRRVFDFQLTFRESETLRLSEASFTIHGDGFQIKHTFGDDSVLGSRAVFVKSNGKLERMLLPHSETTVVSVLPKPPKVRIMLHGSKKQYYTDELVRLRVEVENGEAGPVSGSLSAQLASDAAVPLHLMWSEQPGTTELDDTAQEAASTRAVKSFPQLDPSASHKVELLIRAPPALLETSVAVEVEYTLSKDTATPLRKTLVVELSFVVPFEAKFNFGALLHPDPWPSYFDTRAEHDEGRPGGIQQLWRLSTQVRSLAIEGIMLHKLEPSVDEVVGDSQASFSQRELSTKQTVEPGKIVRTEIQLLTQKYSLDDRRPTAVDATLAVTWSHNETLEQTVTYIPIPRLTLPVSEPRVLCTFADTAPSECDAVLHYHIENPSTHFLTFALTMEASEAFAFSGPKYRALSLAPLSRHHVEYRIAINDQEDEPEAGGRWIWPPLQVIDSYYQKTLRVHPGGAGVKFDDKQNIAVWIDGM